MSRPKRTDFTILGCLSIRPMSGYDIKTFIDRSIVHFWNESYGQIYPALKRLTAAGLIGAEDDNTSGRSRRVYRLTPAGVEVLRGWLVEPAMPDVPRYEMSLKLFFGEQMPVQAAIEHVERYRETQRRQLEQYRAIAPRLEAELEGTPRLPFWRAVLRGGEDYAEMAIRWCDRTLEEFRRLDRNDYPVTEQPVAVAEARGPSGELE